MHSDHFQPGCTVSRAALTTPTSTTSIFVLSGVRTSSAASKLLPINPAMVPPKRAWCSPVLRRRGRVTHSCNATVSDVDGAGTRSLRGGHDVRPTDGTAHQRHRSDAEAPGR